MKTKQPRKIFQLEEKSSSTSSLSPMSSSLYNWKLKTFLLLLILSLPPVILAEDDKMKETEQQISALTAGLGSEKFEVREDSQAKLLALGEKQYDLAVSKYLESHIRIKDPEVRFRLKNILRPLVIKHDFRQKGFIGVSMQVGRIPQKIGAEVFLPIEIVNVIPDFPAEKNGFNVGDQILKVDGNICNEKFQSTEIVNYISAKKPGTSITFLLQSDGKQVTKEVVIAERPALPNEPTIEELQDKFFQNWLRVNLKAAEKKLSNNH